MLVSSSNDHILTVRDFVVKLSSIQELENWLINKGINTSHWGVGNTKSLLHLWHELQSGDACLTESPPMRVVNVVQVFIRRDNLLLLETIQEMANGQRRYRNQPPAEKMKLNEHYLDAASRGLFEELGIMTDRISFIEQTHYTRTFISESPSYPGLSSQYTFHDIEANIDGLPKNDFWYENHAFEKGDPIKKHYWSWCLPEEMNMMTSNLNSRHN